MRTFLFVLTLFFAAVVEAKSEIWIYTSIYKEFITPIQKAFEAQNPDISLQIFQGGSEKIQAKVEAEIQAGKPQADVIATSDPFWSYDLGKRGLTLEGDKLQPNYYSAMILIVHQSLPTASRPKSYDDLTKEGFKNLIQTGSPLESGTAFSSVAYLSDKYGWDYYKKLRGNNLSSQGGNSTVIQKVESGEKKIGVVLLENALAAKKRGSPIDIIYPSDGAILIPSVQVVLKSTKNKEAAQKLATFLLSKEGQSLIRNGYMYSVRKDVAAPEGALSFEDLSKTSKPWPDSFISAVAKDSKNIKKKFSQIVLQ